MILLFKGRVLALNGLSSESSKENHPCKAFVFIYQGYSHNTSMDCRPTFCVNWVSRSVPQCHHHLLVFWPIPVVIGLLCYFSLLSVRYLNLPLKRVKNIGFISYNEERFLISKPLPFSSRSCKAKLFTNGRVWIIPAYYIELYVHRF
jgi:hypothetical protein